MDISVVPLRLGAGVKIKVLESLGAGLPVVTTDVGAEGIMAENGNDFIVENDPKVFATKVNELISNKEKREIMSIYAKRVIKKNYFKGYNAEVLKSILCK